MKLFKPCAVVLINALSLLACACAQTQTPPAPYQRAGTYPAELQMMRRLIEIAEGPPPSKEALETEFGLTYKKSPSYSEYAQDFYASGQFPFNPGDAGQHSLFPAGNRPQAYFISFRFLDDDQLRASSRSFCVSQDALTVELEKRSWQLRKFVVQPHSIRDEDHIAKFGRYSRRVSFFPLFSACVRSIYIHYAELPLSPTPNSSTPSIQTPGDQK